MTGALPSQEENGGPIFVVGSMRSGSTLLRLILDSHSDIAIGAETGFMGGLRCAKDIPNWKFGTGWYERLNWSEQEFDERLREFYSGMFRRYAREQGKRRWGEKTPFHTAHIAQMARIFPDSVFVGIVRHPGAVAASLRKNFHYTFDDALTYWSATNLDLVRGGTGLGSRFVLCRYEDLVHAQEELLRELLGFVGETWDPAVLDHHRVQRDKGAPRVVEGSTKTQDPVDPRRADRWVEGTSRSDELALGAVADLAGFFGYDSHDPAVLDSSTGSASPTRWLVDGEQLSSRRSHWQHRIDFDARPFVPVMDARPEEVALRLAQAEQALARARSRRAVRFADAVRRLQRTRSVADARALWTAVRPAGARAAR